MKQNIVARYQDGTILKGTSSDFFPNRETFHVTDVETAEVKPVAVANLKAVFFVHTLEGNAEHKDRNDVERAGLGRKIEVVFNDGETMVGYTSGYSPGRPAFFVFPSDPESNNDRVFVVTSATKDVKFV